MPLRLLLAPLLIFSVSYVWFIAPYHFYLSADAFKLNLTALLLLALVIGQLAALNRSNATTFFLALFFLFKILPLFVLVNVNQYSESMAFVYAVVAFEIFYLSYFLKLTVPTFRHLDLLAKALAGGAVAFTAYTLVTKVGLSSINFDLFKVYDFRTTRSDIEFGTAFDYVERWANTIFLPFLLIIFVRDRRWLLAAGMLAVSLIFFGLSNHKSYVAAIVAVVGFYVFLGSRRPERWLLRAVVSLLLIVIAIDWLTGGIYAQTLITRRAFFVPARLDIGYISLFSEIGHVWWSDSVLSGILTYPFQERYPYLVAAEVLNSPETNANNGFLGTGYMHAGLPGIVFYSIILSTIMAYLNGLGEHKRRLAISIVAYPIMAIVTSSDLFTGMLTGGLAVALLLVMLAKSDSHSLSTMPATRTHAAT